MSRLQSIEKALMAINPAVFQELCDHYLSLKNNNYLLLSRTGSQSGKQTTVKGTPDTLLLLPDGKYLLVEYSTNKTAEVTKLKEDISKCLDTSKTHIAVNEIAEIIICINFNLSQAQIDDLTGLISGTQIRLSFHTLDSLSIDLHFNHRDLVHEYLGLPLDTGQIVSIDRFINEYDRAAHHIATPLNNVFLHRETELAALKRALEGSDFITLTGPPGIGKTKLAIEAIQSFLQEHLNFQAYAVSYKSFGLLDDLYQYLKADGNYVLFVDDANRIDAFSQITGFYRSLRTGRLKIILTVRDYAYQEIERLCREFAPLRIDLDKLTDQQLTDIIQSDSFQILDKEYQKEIIRIADGNPRLAIMAALLSNEQRSLAALRDVSDLFDRYFGAFVKDIAELDQVLHIRILGLIAFFYTLPYKDKEIMVPVLDAFAIDYYDFIGVIDQLEQLELVEIQFEHVKVPEQNLAIYFFYRAFLKESQLSFETLLTRYFDTHQNRFRECVISALNTFNDKLILEKAKPALLAYWEKIKDDRAAALRVLTTFWYFIPTEALTFIYYLITNDEIPEQSVYEWEREASKRQDFSERDGLLEILSEFFRTGMELKQAVELGIEYIRRKPALAGELIRVLTETIIFKYTDARIGFYRQQLLADLLLEKVAKGDDLYVQVFFVLAKTLLKFKFQYSEGGRNMQIHIYTYPLPLTPQVQAIRRNIWEGIDKYFSRYPVWAFEALASYALVSPDVTPEVMAFDIPFVVSIIHRHLDPGSFGHCQYVQDQIRWCKSSGLKHPDFTKLSKRFRNSTYAAYLKLDWNRFRDKELYEFDDMAQYEALKTKELRSSFVLRSAEEVKTFYTTFAGLKAQAKNDWGYNQSLEIVLDENFQQDFERGYELLQEIISHDNAINYVPRLSFQNILKRREHADRIYKLLRSRDFPHQEQCLFSFFELIDDALITPDQPQIMAELVKNLKVNFNLHVDHLSKYLRFDASFFQQLLREVYAVNTAGKVQVWLWMNFFEKHFDQLGDDLDLIEDSYLQQDLMQDHFDFKLEGLRRILAKDPGFILTYIRKMDSNDRRSFSRESRNLGLIWEMEGSENILTQIFDQEAAAQRFYGIGETFLNAFFTRAAVQQKEQTEKFLLNYLTRNVKDTKKVNLVVDVVRHSRKDLFEAVLLAYVAANQDVADFDKIWWRGNGGSYSGNVIIGDLEAADWRNILAILDKSGVGIVLLPIKKYVSSRIDGSLSQGDWERKGRFLDKN